MEQVQKNYNVIQQSKRALRRHPGLLAGIVISSIFATTTLIAQESNETTDIAACSQDIVMPVFGALTRAAGPESTRTITASVKLGEKGVIESIAFDGGNAGHHAEIEFALRSSEFSGKCAKRILRIIYVFAITGAPTECPVVATHFISPNEFKLVTRPRSSTIMRLRPIK